MLIYFRYIYYYTCGWGIGTPLSEKKHIQNLSPAVIALYFIILSLSFLFNKKIFKTILIIFSIPISIINTIIVWYLLFYGSLIDSNIMGTITNTNLVETMEFISFVFNYKMIIALLTITIPFILIYFMQPFKIQGKTKIIVLSILLLTSFIIILLTHNQRWVIREIAPAKVYNTYVITQEDKKKFLQLLKEADKKALVFDNITNKLTKNEKQTFVFVISESQNKLHFSCYGYTNKTTPFLDSIKDELYIFNNIHSPSVYTNSSVEKMITFADNYNNLQGYEAGDIIRLFQNAGFRTYWLSNQFFLGPHESLYSAIAYRADEAIFLNQISGFFLETKNHDNALLEPFKNALNDDYDKKFIVFHLMGSHAPFEARYPKGFGSFDYNLGIKDVTGSISKQKQIATYDNSIEYTDYLLKDIITLLEQENNESFLLFLSDHGVDVYDTYPDIELPRSHIKPSPSMIEIPFILWASNKYKNNYKDVISRVKLSLNKHYQTDRVIHTIMDLSRIHHNKYIDSDNILSNNFKYKDSKIENTIIDENYLNKFKSK